MITKYIWTTPLFIKYNKRNNIELITIEKRKLNNNLIIIYLLYNRKYKKLYIKEESKP